jgi:hypothetical protein
VARVAASPVDPSRTPRWFTHVELNLPDPSPGCFDPWSPRWPSSGGAPPRKRSPVTKRRRPARPNPGSRPIRGQRARLDHAWGRSEPPDPDSSVQIRRYRFGLVILLKSPRIFLESTHSPMPFKSICRSAPFLVFRPLDSLEIEPAVQPQ